MADSHEQPSDAFYIRIAIALAVLTAISYVGDLFSLPKTLLVFLVLGVAVVKASLVCVFFMHLKFDWDKVRVMIVAACVLSLILVFALTPDIGMRTGRLDPANSTALDHDHAEPDADH